MKITLTEKQGEVYEAFISGKYTEILVGGGGSGGKTRGLAEIVTLTCLQYGGVSWLVGRDQLKKLKQSTRLTFQKVRNNHGMKRDVDYHSDMAEMTVTFKNGSKIFFMDLGRMPSDPLYDRLGSMELTRSRIDEAQEVERVVIDTLSARYRQNVKKYNIDPCTILTCNPRKGHLYDMFIRNPSEHRTFIQILYTDNPHLDQEKYKSGVMKTGNKVQIERLLHGNREYDDTPGKLFEYDRLRDMFTNPITTGKRYISCDVARQGRDLAVIGVRDGFKLIDYKIFKKSSTVEQQEAIKSFSQKYSIPMSNVIVDEDGVGGGVVDSLRCKGFVNNSSPLDKANFQNLKTQCYFELQKHYGKINLSIITDKGLQEDIVEELDVVCEKDIDKDGKKKITSKDDIKEMLGRSPDRSDMIMMRCWFEIKKSYEVFVL